VNQFSDLLELSTKQPCLHPVFGPPFTPYPLFQWYPQSKDILLNLSIEMLQLSTKCSNAQGWRLIIVVVQVGAVKNMWQQWRRTRKMKDRDETQFTTEIDDFLSFTPPLNGDVLFSCFFKNLTLCMTKLRVPVLC